MGDLSREEFYNALSGLSKAMDGGFEGIHDRLDRLNGKTESQGNRLTAVETKIDERTGAGGKQGAMAGGIVAGIAALVELARHFLMAPK